MNAFSFENQASHINQQSRCLYYRRIDNPEKNQQVEIGQPYIVQQNGTHEYVRSSINNLRQNILENIPNRNDLSINSIKVDSDYKSDQSQCIMANFYSRTMADSGMSTIESPYKTGTKNSLSQSPLFLKSMSSNGNGLSSSKKSEDEFIYYGNEFGKRDIQYDNKVNNFTMPTQIDETEYFHQMIYDGEHFNPTTSNDNLNIYAHVDRGYYPDDTSIIVSKFIKTENPKMIIYKLNTGDVNPSDNMNATTSSKMNQFNENIAENDGKTQYDQDMPRYGIRAKRAYTLASNPQYIQEIRKLTPNQQATTRKSTCRIPIQPSQMKRQATNQSDKKQRESPNLKANHSDYNLSDTFHLQPRIPTQSTLDESLLNSTSNFARNSDSSIKLRQKKIQNKSDSLSSISPIVNNLNPVFFPADSQKTKDSSTTLNSKKGSSISMIQSQMLTNNSLLQSEILSNSTTTFYQGKDSQIQQNLNSYESQIPTEFSNDFGILEEKMSQIIKINQKKSENEKSSPIEDFIDSQSNIPIPNKPTRTSTFSSANNYIQNASDGNKKKAKTTIEKLRYEPLLLNNRTTSANFDSSNADLSLDNSRYDEKVDGKITINQLMPKISNINFANAPGKSSTNLSSESNQYPHLHRKTISNPNQPKLENYCATQNDDISDYEFVTIDELAIEEKKGRATVTNGTMNQINSTNLRYYQHYPDRKNKSKTTAGFELITPKKQKKKCESSLVSHSETPNSNTNEILSSIKDISVSLMDSTKKLLNIGQGTTRLKCKCGLDLNEQEACPNSLKWLFTKYNKNELDYLNRMYMKIISLNDFDGNKKQISLDINRTYPDSQFYASDDGLQSLSRVLECIAKYDPQIGYVQGMNFIAASLLYHAEEYIAFWLFIMIFEKFEMRDIYMANLPGLTKHCQIIDFLILNYLPKVYSHFCKLNIVVEMFCTEWICALFGSIIPLEKMVIILEEFITDGWPFFYKVILALLEYFQSDLLKASDISEIMLVFKYIINNNQKEFPGIKHVKIKWEQIIKSSKQIEIDTAFICNLHTKFDQETKRFNFMAK